MRLLHEGGLLRCFRNSVLVTYVSTLPSTSSSAPCISSFVQSLSTFETNVRDWHFVQHSLYTTPIGGRSLSELSITSDTLAGSWGLNRLCLPGVVGAAPLRPPGHEESTPPGCVATRPTYPKNIPSPNTGKRIL